MKEQAIKEILNTLDVNGTDIAFDDITYDRLIESSINDGNKMSASMGYTTHAFSRKMKKLFPEKEENAVNWYSYIMSLVPYKQCGKCKEVKPLDGFGKHSGKLSGYQDRCKTCRTEYQKTDEVAIAYKAQHYIDNKEKMSAKNKEWYEENKHTDAFKQGSCARSAKRRALKSQAIPRWYEEDLVKELYKQSCKETHIDHIIPLSNKKVCGLHCIANLQAIPAKENFEKNNKFNPEYIEDLIMSELALDGLAYYEFTEEHTC